MTQPAHPARFSNALLPVIDELLGDAKTVLDPFAGVGRIHELNRLTVGVEIEPEWAATHPNTLEGDATKLWFHDATFDAIATSPTYGNRMADNYDGRDGSKRNTYRTALGHDLDKNNSGGMQWGLDYRALHWVAYGEAIRVLKPGGRFVLNMKDHIRKGERVHVTDWHIEALQLWGLRLDTRRRVPLRGNRFGANADLRIDYEEVILLWK